MEDYTTTVKIEAFNCKLFNIYELIELSRHNREFIKNLEKTIRIYRSNNTFRITDLVDEYVNLAGLNDVVKYSVIYTDNIIVSTCRLYVDNIDKKCYINLVYTNPAYRCKKICKRHIEHLIYIHKDTISTFELDVLVDNIPAIKCYTNIGFQKQYIHTRNEKVLHRMQLKL